jgi:arylsulfatase A-like enzyme
VRNGFNASRSADITIVSDPYWITGTSGTTHGAPFSYDNHVPLIFLGPGIRPGRYDGNVMVNDVAPTLATMLEIETPSGSVGRVLDEMLPNAPVSPALVR